MRFRHAQSIAIVGLNSSTGSTTGVAVTQQSTTFYFLTGSTSQTVTFTLGYGNSQSVTAKTTLKVGAPWLSVATPALGQWQVQTSTSGPGLDFGFPIGTPGITINAQATSPSGYTGTYQWAQIVTTNTHNNTTGSTMTSCSTGTGLDNQFPASTGLNFSDSPSTVLQSAYNKQTWSLGFTTYFMWRPGLTNDIAVPLGYVTWTASGDATQSGGTWTVQSDSTRSASTFQLSASYPNWTNKVTNGSNPCASQSQ